MDHRAEFLGTLAAGQDAADQALRTTQTRLTIILAFGRLARPAGRAFPLELQAGRERVAQASHHLLDPLQVEKQRGT